MATPEIPEPTGEPTATPARGAAKRPRREPKASTFVRERANKRRVRQLVGVAAVSLLVAGIVAALMGAAPPGRSLNTSLHQHPNLEIFVSGAKVELPVNIGIDANLWKDHSMDEYQEMDAMSPIHTHDSSGDIHLEMGKWHACTLGDFFDVWGQPFDRDRVLSTVGTVTLTVDGNANDEYRNLVLQDRQQIVIRVG